MRNTRNTETASALWKNMDKILKEKNMTLKELASVAGLNYDTLRSWRTRCIIPSVQEAYQLAHAVGLSVDEMFFPPAERISNADPEILSLLDDLSKTDQATLALIRLALKSK